jgi:hypothetical protein
LSLLPGDGDDQHHQDSPSAADTRSVPPSTSFGCRSTAWQLGKHGTGTPTFTVVPDPDAPAQRHQQFDAPDIERELPGDAALEASWTEWEEPLLSFDQGADHRLVARTSHDSLVGYARRLRLECRSAERGLDLQEGPCG